MYKILMVANVIKQLVESYDRKYIKRHCHFIALMQICYIFSSGLTYKFNIVLLYEYEYRHNEI